MCVSRHQTIESHNRILGLDIVRAVAILLVVSGHGSFILKDTVLDGPWSLPPIDGVDIFFVLSGFLIGGILLHDINDARGFGGHQLLTFWKRRWFRTLPNYYLILAVNYFVATHGIIKADPDAFTWQFIVFTQNFKEPFFGFFWESWSLSVEEWFYLISPAAILVLLRFTPPKQSFLTVTLFLILAPLAYRVSIADPSITHAVWSTTFRKTVLCRLDAIGYGLLLAWVLYYHKHWLQQWKWTSFLLGWTALAFVLAYEQPASSFYKQTLYFSISSVAIMLLLPMFAAYKGGTGWWQRSITHISKISYSMYLINLSLVACVIRDNFPPTGGFDGLLKYAVYWAAVIGIATLLYRYYEKPITALRDQQLFRIPNKKAPTTTARGQTKRHNA